MTADSIRIPILRTFFTKRKLISELAKREISDKYRGLMFGPLWMFCQSVLSMATKLYSHLEQSLVFLCVT